MKTKVLLSLGFIFSFLFSAQAEDVNVIQKLDSIITINTEQEVVTRELFVWNEFGLLEQHTTDGYEINAWSSEKTDLLIVINYEYNNLKQLIKTTTETTNQYGHQTQIVEYGYDDNGVVNEVINSSNFGYGWNYTGRITTTRDSDGLLTDSINYYGSPDNWEVSDKLQYQYDDEKRLESVETYTPNFTTGSLVLFLKETYTYDTTDEGHIRRIGLAQQHTDDALEPVNDPSDMWKDEQITNAAGLVLSYEKNSWSEFSSSWTGIEKYTTTQTTNMLGNTFTTRTNYSWPWGASDWAISTVIDIVVPSPTSWGAKTVSHTEKKPNAAYDPEDELSNQFTKTKEVFFGYGFGTSLISKKTSVWTDGVESTEEFLYTCDENIEINQVCIPELFTQEPYFFTNKPTTARKYEGVGMNTSLVETATFHYSEIGTSAIAATQVNNNTTAYFAEGTLNVETPNVEAVSVYSLSGNLLYTVNKVEGAASFDIALAQGIYIIKGSTGWTVKAIK